MDFLTDAEAALLADRDDIEIRVEVRSGGLGAGELGFALVPLADPPHVFRFAITQSEDLMRERFLGRDLGPYLCGAYPGRSKFFMLDPPIDDHMDKAQVIAALGLRGYQKTAKPGPIYVVHIELEQAEALERVDPKVPLLYKRRKPGGRWEPMPHFIPGGWTAGGVREVVGRTFEVDEVRISVHR